jgi:ATP-dependent Lon protease
LRITREDIQTKYFKAKREMKTKPVHETDEVGVINCLWANDLGMGGILSAHARMVLSDKFLSFKCTGLLDEMMKESFEISLTLALEATGEARMRVLREKYDGAHKYGIHMHMGDGSVHKSGTSAGIAVSILLYSLLNGRAIKHDVAVTGEAADLRGTSGEIGALKTKVLYGIQAGVRHFLYPVDNQRDLDEFLETHKGSSILEGVRFDAVCNLDEALALALVPLDERHSKQRVV